MKGWNVRKPGARRRKGRIGGFGGCKGVVVVGVAVVDAGSIGPWRPGEGGFEDTEMIGVKILRFVPVRWREEATMLVYSKLYGEMCYETNSLRCL